MSDQSNESGLPTPLPPSFCFQSENAVFYSFKTLNTDYPAVNYEDSTATVTLSNVSCLLDTTHGNGLNIAVFGASDACDESTFSEALACQTNVTTSQNLFLSGLEPNTTYYIVVSGLVASTTLIDPSECTFEINVSGPAVTYDLGVMAEPALIFQGQEATLSANEFGSFEYEWQGELLNDSSGNPVTAHPDEIGRSYSYTATITIDECFYSESANVMVVPAITVYNTFTPNGDGINDTWEIHGILKPENRNSQITVYSRWGQKVFQTVGYNNDWTGDGLPAATYYYVIELNPLEYDSDPYTGTVTIIY